MKYLKSNNLLFVFSFFFFKKEAEFRCPSLKYAIQTLTRLPLPLIE